MCFSTGARGSAIAVVFTVASIGVAAMPAPAWSQPGTVMSHQKISDTSGNFTATIDNGDEVGGAVAGLGDLDGAGPAAAALAVGAIGDDDGGLDRGAVYVIFLDAAGAALSYQKISDTAGNFTAVLDNADEFGATLSGLGDLDGAGSSVAAMAVGCSLDDDGGSDRGAVYILFLDSSGSVTSHTKISDTSGGFTAPLANGDEFGGAVAWLGDIDGVGPSAGALAVGAIGDSDGGTGRGAVYILFLNPDGSVLSHTKISDTAGNFSATLDDVDEFGSSVAALGDLDGAGPSVAALAVGAVGDDDGGSGRGAVYVLFLDATGTVLSHQKISSTSGAFTGTLDNLDSFGDSVAGLGDLDASGSSRAALAVGATGDDDGGSLRGATWVLFLDPSGTVVSHQKISDLAGNFTGTLDSGDEFGGSCAALGDLDGAGTSRIAVAVGAIGDDDGGSNRGSVWVLFLEGGLVTEVTELPANPHHVLERARPNPFNPTTTIPFRIAASGRVEIDLVDVQGRVVRKIAVGDRSEGAYRVTFDGRDSEGRALPSGTYFYRMYLNGEAVSEAQKAVLIK